MRLMVGLNKRSLAVLISALTVVSVLLGACRPGPTPTTPTPVATSTVAPTPTPLPPLPPQVIQVAPVRGEEQLLDAPVQLVFDQPMDAASVEAAFTIEPAVAGDFEWLTPRMVQFKPAGVGFERATRYAVAVEEKARSQAGLALETPVQFHFATVGFLEVSATQPAEDAAGVAPDAVVTVLFNRPVVPLTGIEDQDNLPQPLTFVPSVRGKGEWLNTSIYTFTPEEGFEPATTYKARVAAGLADTTGGVLADDFTWEFTTIMPAVVATHPDRDTIYVSVEPTVHVAFNQPMDHASAEAAFELKNTLTGEVVEGTFEWHDAGLVLPRGYAYEPYQWSWSRGEGPERVGAETMSFTPDVPLDYDTTYLAKVATSAWGARGQAGMSQPHQWTFVTIAYPRIISTNPQDGEQRASPWDRLEISFSSPMDPASINGNFTVSPPVSETEVFTYWWELRRQVGARHHRPLAHARPGPADLRAHALPRRQLQRIHADADLCERPQS
jgi:hypothetical protein